MAGITLTPGAASIFKNYFADNTITDPDIQDSMIAGAAELIDDPLVCSDEEATLFIEILKFNLDIKNANITKTNFIWDLFKIEFKSSGVDFSKDAAAISDCIKKAQDSSKTLASLSPEKKIAELHKIIQATLASTGIVLKPGRTDLLSIGLQNGTIDCDTYAYLFAAVAFELQLPVSIYITSDAKHVLLGYNDNGTVTYFDPITGTKESAEKYPNTVNLSDSPEKLKAQFWANVGNYNYSRGEYTQAIDCYKEALRVDDKNITARINLDMITAADSLAGLPIVDPEALSAPTGLAAFPIVGGTILQTQSTSYTMNLGAGDSFGMPGDPGFNAGRYAEDPADPFATGIFDAGFTSRVCVAHGVADFNPAFDNLDTDGGLFRINTLGVGPHSTGGSVVSTFSDAIGTDQIFNISYDNGGVYQTEVIPEFVLRHFSQGSGTIQLIPTGGGVTIDCQNLASTTENNSGGFTTTRQYYLGYTDASGNFVVQQTFANAAAMQNAALTANVMDSTRNWALCYVDQITVGGKNYYIKSAENIDITSAIQQFKATVLKAVDLAGNGLVSTPVYNGGTFQFEATYTMTNPIPAPPAGVTYEYALVWDGGEQVLAGFNPNLATSTIALPANVFSLTNLKLVCRTIVQNIGGTAVDCLNSDGSTAATHSVVDLVGAPIQISSSTSQTRTLAGSFKNTGVTAGTFEYRFTGATSSGLVSGMTRVWRVSWTGAPAGSPATIADPTAGGMFTIPGNPNPTAVTNMQIYYEDYSQYDGTGNPIGTPEVSNAISLNAAAPTTNTRFRGTLKVTVDPANITIHHYKLIVPTDDINSYTPFDPATMSGRTFYVEINGVSSAVAVATANGLPTNAELDTALATANPFSDTISLYYVDTYIDLSTKQSESISLVTAAAKLVTTFDYSVSPLKTGNSRNLLAFAPETATTTILPVVAINFFTENPICPILVDTDGKPISFDVTKTKLSDGRYQWTASFPSGITITDIRTQDCGKTTGTVTFVNGETQDIDIYNTENLVLDAEKTAPWGEKTIKPSFYSEKVFPLKQLTKEDSLLMTSGEKILSQLGIDTTKVDHVDVVIMYRNHKAAIPITIRKTDRFLDVLSKIYDKSVIPQSEITGMGGGKVVEYIIDPEIPDTAGIFEPAGDNTSFVFKAGLTPAKISEAYQGVIAKKYDGLTLTMSVGSELSSSWDEFKAILAKSSTKKSISEGELKSIPFYKLFIEEIVVKYFRLDSQGRYTLRDGFTIKELDKRIEDSIVAVMDMQRHLQEALDKILTLYEKYPAGGDAEKLVDSRLIPLSTFTPNLLAGKGPLGDYLGADASGKMIFFLEPKTMQFGMNYDAQVASYMETTRPKTPMFFDFRVEPYLLTNFSGFFFNITSMLDVYNDQLMSQTTPFVGVLGGVGLSTGFDEWGGVSLRYLGDSFSNHGYLLTDLYFDHTFEFGAKTDKTPPFVSALGLKFGWETETVLTQYPAQNSWTNPSKFTLGLDLDFFKAVRLATEWQQTFDWVSTSNFWQTTVLSGTLSGLDKKWPWFIGGKVQMQPDISEYSFKAGICDMPLSSFGLFNVAFDWTQGYRSGLPLAPVSGFSAGITIRY